jgi:hypothetical protein
MRAVVIDADHNLGLDMKQEFRGIKWTFKLGPMKHSRQQRGVAFLADRALAKVLGEVKGDKVSVAEVTRAAEAELGEKLGKKTWQRMRTTHLAKSPWSIYGKTFVRR